MGTRHEQYIRLFKDVWETKNKTLEPGAEFVPGTRTGSALAVVLPAFLRDTKRTLLDSLNDELPVGTPEYIEGYDAGLAQAIRTINHLTYDEVIRNVYEDDEYDGDDGDNGPEVPSDKWDGGPELMLNLAKEELHDSEENIFLDQAGEAAQQWKEMTAEEFEAMAENLKPGPIVEGPSHLQELTTHVIRLVAELRIANLLEVAQLELPRPNGQILRFNYRTQKDILEEVARTIGANADDIVMVKED